MYYTVVHAAGIEVASVGQGGQVTAPEAMVLDILGVEGIVDLGSGGVGFRIDPRKVKTATLPNSLDTSRNGSDFHAYRHARLSFETRAGINVEILPIPRHSSRG